MTLIYRNGPDLPENCLTVPNEAVRGLRGCLGAWKIFVSDPEPMSVSAFSLTKTTLAKAATALGGMPQIQSRQGMELMQWILSQEYIEVEKIDARGQPSVFPQFNLAGPLPNMPVRPPQIDP